MGLFDKKYCDVCGEKIGLFGNRKLEDGNLCKECAAKLSPWFDERRSSTVEQIKAQLNYREANKEAVAAFHVTRTIGRDTKVLIDEDARKFMVTSARNYVEANPDVIDFSDVTGCDFDIDEDRDEIKREVKQSDGSTKEVSFVPPHYSYEYDFKIIISVNNPYFHEIDFKLNSSSVDIETVGPISTNNDPRLNNPNYAEYKQMGEDIKATLLQARQESRDQVVEAAKPKVPVRCPSCGATTIPDAKGCCEYCGSALN